MNELYCCGFVGDIILGNGDILVFKGGVVKYIVDIWGFFVVFVNILCFMLVNFLFVNVYYFFNNIN